MTMNPTQWRAAFNAMLTGAATLLLLTSVLALLLASAPALAETTRLEPLGPPTPVETTDSENQTSSARDYTFSDTTGSGFSASPIPGYSTDHWSELLIPLVAILLIFGGLPAVLIVLAVMHYRSARIKAQIQADTIAKALESGRELPLELLAQDAEPAPRTQLKRGVKNVGLGVGLLLALSLMMGISIGAIGFIFIGIGTAQLVLWKLDKPEPQDAA